MPNSPSLAWRGGLRAAGRRLAPLAISAAALLLAGGPVACGPRRRAPTGPDGERVRPDSLARFRYTGAVVARTRGGELATVGLTVVLTRPQAERLRAPDDETVVRVFGGAQRFVAETYGSAAQVASALDDGAGQAGAPFGGDRQAGPQVPELRAALRLDAGDPRYALHLVRVRWVARGPNAVLPREICPDPAGQTFSPVVGVPGVYVCAPLNVPAGDSSLRRLRALVSAATPKHAAAADSAPPGPRPHWWSRWLSRDAAAEPGRMRLVDPATRPHAAGLASNAAAGARE